MSSASFLLRVALLSGLVFSAACATSRAQLPAKPEQQQARHPAGIDPRSGPPTSSLQRGEAHTAAFQQARATAGGFTRTESLPVLIGSLPGNRLRLAFPTSPSQPGMEKLSVEEIRPLLAAFGSPSGPRPDLDCG